MTEGFFYDKERLQEFPYLLYAPSPLEGPYPVIILSHGLGGSRYDAAYLGESLAGAGYAVFAIQHIGSDDSLWEGYEEKAEIKRILRRASSDPDIEVARFWDVAFVLDELARQNEDRQSPLFRALDLNRAGMAGLGLGARGVFLAAGETAKYDYSEPRIKAGIALSPSLPSRYLGLPEDRLPDLYSHIRIPILHITGSADQHPYIDGFGPADHIIPYRLMPRRHQYLLVIEGAGHNTLRGGSDFFASNKNDIRGQNAVVKSAILFFDKYLQEKPWSTLAVGLSGDHLTREDRLEYK